MVSSQNQIFYMIELHCADSQSSIGTLFCIKFRSSSIAETEPSMPSFCIGKHHRYTIPQKHLGQNLPWQNWTKQCQVSCFQSSIIDRLTTPAHIKVYTFVFAKTHGTNHWHKSSPLATREIENFYFAFTSGARPPLLL